MSDSPYKLKNLRSGSVFLLNQTLMKFGRSSSNQISIPDPALSRHHATFYYNNGELIIEDNKSQNGFSVNGKFVRGSVALRSGDKISIGSSEYEVLGPPAEEVSFVTRHTKKSNEVFSQLRSTQKNSPMRGPLIFLGLVGVLVFVVLMPEEKPATENRAPATAGPDIENPLSADAFKAKPVQKKAQSTITSEAKFTEALRDYNNALYNRALLGFKEALSFDPNNSQAKLYIDLTQEKLKKSLESLIQDARKSLKALQYGRAKFQGMQILTIMSEEVSGFARQIAQENLSTESKRENQGQEQTLLRLPCEMTRQKDLCEETKLIIKESRIRLGEEDVLK